tara:strand:- start:3123 stop:5519 length:2397 start_codon:yes stop_codon:yes gene_type:complete
MVNKVTFTQPQLIDFITENVKEIVDINKQHARILQEQGLFGNLFGGKGTVTPYEPEEAVEEIEKFNSGVQNSACSPGASDCEVYDVLKMFDDMILAGVDVRKVLTLLHNLPNWQKNNPNPHLTDYYKKNPDMVATPPKLSSEEIKTISKLLKIIDVPFVNKEQGNSFRQWMNKNYPDWKAADGDVLDPEGSYNNKWISQAWRHYRKEFIKTDLYVPEIPFEVLSAALLCLKTQHVTSTIYSPDLNISVPTKITDIGIPNFNEQLTQKEREDLVKYIKSLMEEGVQLEQVSNIKRAGASKEEWKEEVEELRTKLKTQNSRERLATDLDPTFRLVTKYQQGQMLQYFRQGNSGCNALGKWLVEVRFTEEDEYQAMIDDLDSDGDGMIKLMPDANRRCMACHDFLGINARKPNAQERLLMQMSFQSMKGMDDMIMGKIKAFSDWFMDGGYHLIIDIVAFVAYLACPFTAGIGCAVSVALDIINAYTYVKFEDDYYMAGMQLAFAVVPGGEGMKYLLKNAAAKKAIGNFFRAIWGKGELGNAMKAARKEFKALGPAAKKELKEVFGPAVKVIKNALKTVTGGLASIRRLAKSHLPSGLYGTLKKMVYVLNATFRALVYAIEMFVYDPQFPAELIELLAGQNSFSDWLKERPKIGLDLWSNYLEWKDNFRGAITTTPYDCTGKVFVWLKEDVKTDNDVSIQQSWLDDGYKEEDFNEENVWKEWQNGWHPANITNQLIVLYNGIKPMFPELIEKYDTYLKDCFTFKKYMNSKKDEDRKMMYLIFTKMGVTEAEYEEMMDILNKK